jgi:Tfp pilus assembly protein PilF
MRPSPHLAALALVALALPGCASRAARSTTPPPVSTLEMEAMRIDVERTPAGTRARSYDARSLLEDGDEALVLRRFDEAIAAYDKLLQDFPDSSLAVAALYQAGQASEGKKDYAAAAARYRRLVETTSAAPATREDSKNAHFRLGAVLAESDRPAEAARWLERVLGFDDLSADERLEALARLGYVHLEAGDAVAAEDVLRQALGFHRDVQGTTRLETTYWIGMAQFYLGEIPHREFLAIPMRYPEEQLQRDVERKSQLLLLARDRFVKTIEYRNPVWATAAVFQIASMYKAFWDHWMAVPLPDGLAAAEASEYTRQVNEEPGLRRLLERSLHYHEKNLAMAREARVTTGWSQQSGVEASAIRALLARIDRGDFVSPGTPAPGDSGSQPTPDVYSPARPDR